MRRTNQDFVKWAVFGLMVALALGASARSAEAAVGDIIANVTIPASANCGNADVPDFGTALAIVSGGKAGFPAIPTLVVTSCRSFIEGTASNLFFLDPSTEPATLVKTLTTSVTNPWDSLAFRADTGDLLGCSEGEGNSLYAIHFSPFDATPPTAGVATATFLQSGPSGSTCDGIAWDTKDKTIYQTSTNFDTLSGSFNVLHVTPGSATVTSIPSGCGNFFLGGIGIAGVSLFVGCSQLSPSVIGGLDVVAVADAMLLPATIRQLDKASGNLVGGRSLNLPVGMVDPAGVPDDPSSFGLAPSMRDALWTKDGVSASSSFFGKLVAIEMAAGTTGQNSGSPLAFPAACDQVTGSAPDTDGDGLPDCWEDGNNWSDHLPGISVDGTYTPNRDPSFRAVTLCVDMNGNGVFDAGECASPNHKDIFVEADYMQFHKPDPVAINNVVTAFANAPVANPDGTKGIRLHVQIDDQLTHANNTALVPCTPAGGDANFDTLKASSFGTAAERAAPNAAARLSAKRFAYHYVLFVHNQTGSTSSGCAEILGNDLMVSLGSFGVVNGHNVGTTDQQGGTFMHELGHNLNLRHGGFENVNCKPNYTSRMNYAYQFSSPVNPAPLDYSRQALATLIESNLTESLGVGGYTGNIAFGPPTGIPAKPKVASGAGAVNWNLAGTATDTNVVRDLNSFGISGCPASPGETLVGFNDWANINFNFRASLDFGDGAHTFETPEINSDDARTISVDTDGDGIVDFDDNCPLTPNAAQNADACAIVIHVLRPVIPSTSQGVVQVAILSSLTRDATMIDPATILVTGAAAQGPGIWSLRVRQDVGGNFPCNRRDVNGDGRLDLVCQFKVDARQLPLGVSNVTLDAMTLGGEAVRGTDTLDVKDVGAGQ